MQCIYFECIIVLDKEKEFIMNKIINGKRYNTETAKELTQFIYISESEDRLYEDKLYIKKTGEFFIFSKSEKLINSEKLSKNKLDQKCEIIPLTLDEAKSWVNDNADFLYDELFVKNDYENILISVLLPKNIYNILKSESYIRQETQKDIIINSLRQYLDIQNC